ncbi:hypothetical protein GCM10022217_33180 [Chryseobacterium ginsenosidimutans]|uniref:hypothetical protein n=1 Tax=Chryseobacterium ginsenosidimutans TaxID=687846 RepID=UPI0031D524D1
MNYTEKEILEKAKIILKDLQAKYYNEKNIEGASFEKEKSIHGNENKKLPCWTILINEPVFKSAIFLLISDESGEPIYIRSKHKTSEIMKNSDGNYIRK